MIIYLAAFAAGTLYKVLLYYFQPQTFTHFNTAVIELTVASAIVTVGVILFHVIREKRNHTNENS